MMRLGLCLTLCAALVACKSDEPESAPPPAPAPNTPEPAAPAPTEPPVKEHMADHFTAVRDIERALVAGDLKTAQDRARRLAEHESPDALEAWEPHVEAMRTAASELARAEDIAGAAVLASALGNECAACHLTTTAITSFPYEELPAEGTSNKAMMRRHQWAADRLWEGLIGPSESSWNQGAEILAKAPFVPQVTLREEDRETIETLAATVHELATKATTVELDERALLYSELLTTCSSCHGIARKR